MNVILPKLGESIISATVVHWFKKPGDHVALDEPLLEVSTDKVNSEIPSPADGVLQEIIAMPGQEVQVGETLAILSAKGHVKPASSAPSAPVEEKTGEDVLSPAVLRLMKEKGIDLKEIDRIPHTGHGGRLTKKDIEDYAAASRYQPESHEPIERVQMSTMRKAIAENMVRSFYEAPHASLITEIDVTGVVNLIRDEKENFLRKSGAKLSITSFVARAIARAAKAYPLINSSLEKDTIVMKHYVNLGVAVSVEQGVVVPVIHKCHQLTLSEIAGHISDLAEKARKHSLMPNEIAGGTITMTNFGMAGVEIGIPIIRHPEVAIVGIGAMTKKVKVMPDDTTAIRTIMMVSLTFDHRVLDGLYGCGFLNELKKHLEEDLSL